MYKFGKYIKKLSDFCLRVLFVSEDFSYPKILTLHHAELSKIQGKQLQRDSFLHLLPYLGYIREVLWSLKFRNNKRVAYLLGRLLYEVLPEYLVQWEQFDNFTNPLLIIVPSSKQTLRKRGFNQNHLIIKSFLAHGGNRFIKYQPDVIKKIKNIPKQSRTESRAERLENPKGAFTISNRHATFIRGRNIILFDDILTTGATTKEITRVLKRAGAKQIKIVAIAH